MIAVDELNAYLRGLHGPTPSVAHALGSLVPFPGSVGSIDDADVLDLSVAVDLDHAASAPTAFVAVTGRYATSARMMQIERFYVDQLAAAEATVTSSYTLGEGDRLVVEAILADEAKTGYRVLVDDYRGFRSVRVAAEYREFDHHEFFERFANWHGGAVPVREHAEPSGLEITTFASGRRPNALVLYTSRFQGIAATGIDQRRLVEARLDELGWRYREPRPGMLFVQDGPFEAEAHLYGDDHGAHMSFVGEFHLR